MAAVPVGHVPVIGGIAAWHLPLVTITLAFGAVSFGVVEVALVVALLGFVAQTILRSVVVEISPMGLTRGCLVSGRFLGRTTVMAWHSIVSVHTDFRRPGDDTALVTTVRDREGQAIHFTTAMGLRPYWHCLTAVASGAPTARRSGLTGAMLADDPLDRRSVLSAAATAGALALVVVAVVGIHYLWAQGRSSFVRYLEESSVSESAGRPPGPAAR